MTQGTRDELPHGRGKLMLATWKEEPFAFKMEFIPSPRNWNHRHGVTYTVVYPERGKVQQH